MNKQKKKWSLKKSVGPKGEHPPPHAPPLAPTCPSDFSAIDRQGRTRVETPIGGPKPENSSYVWFSLMSSFFFFVFVRVLGNR